LTEEGLQKLRKREQNDLAVGGLDWGGLSAGVGKLQKKKRVLRAKTKGGVESDEAGAKVIKRCPQGE